MKNNGNSFSLLLKHFTETDIFSDEEFEKLISFLTPVTLKKKEFFNRQGELCKYLAFVNSGCLRAFHTDQKGEEYTMYFAFLNWWIGDKTSFYSGAPSRLVFRLWKIAKYFVLIKKTGRKHWIRFRSLKNGIVSKQENRMKLHNKSSLRIKLNLLKKNI